jgi:hypothetical protein
MTVAIFTGKRSSWLRIALGLVSSSDSSVYGFSCLCFPVSAFSSKGLYHRPVYRRVAPLPVNSDRLLRGPGEVP